MGNLLTFPRFKAWDSLGRPLAGGKLYTYIQGTSTAKSAFTDAALTTPHSNPIILNANGEAIIHLWGAYKINLTDANDVQVDGFPIDNVTGWGGVGLGASLYYVDYNEADQGVNGNGQTVAAFIASVGSDEAMIMLAHNSGGATTTYTWDTDDTIPANITVYIENGAILAGDGGDETVTFAGGPRQIIAQPTQEIFDSTISIVFSIFGTVYPEWWGADNTGTDDSSAAFQSAFDAGRIVEMQGGTYKWAATVFLDGSGEANAYEMKGKGRTTVLKPTTAIAIDGSVRYMIRLNQDRTKDYSTEDMPTGSQTDTSPNTPKFLLEDFQVDGSAANTASFMYSQRMGFRISRLFMTDMVRGFKGETYIDNVKTDHCRWWNPIVAVFGPQTTISFDAASSELRDAVNGDFVNDGFKEGMTLLVWGTDYNNYLWEITGVTATALTLDARRGSSASVVDEAAGNTISMIAGGYFLDLDNLGDGFLFENNQCRNYSYLFVNLNKCRGGLIHSNINGIYTLSNSRAVEFLANHIENNKELGPGCPSAVQVRNGDVRIMNNHFNVGYDSTDHEEKEPPILLKEQRGNYAAQLNVSIIDNDFWYANRRSDWDPGASSETIYVHPIRIENWYKSDAGVSGASASILRLCGNVTYNVDQAETEESALGITIEAATSCGAAARLTSKKYYLSSEKEVALTYTMTNHRLLGADQAELIRYIDDAPLMTASDSSNDYTGTIADATTYYYTAAILTERGMSPQSHADGSFVSATVASATNEGTIKLLVTTPPNTYIRIWRSTTANDANIDRYIDLPCYTGRVYIKDSGDYVFGRPWILAGIKSRPGTTNSTYATSFEAADTTPTVNNDTVFVTVDTSDITFFDGGWPGKKITVILGAATDFTDVGGGSGGLQLSGAADWDTGVAGDVIEFIFDGVDWLETNRSVNT